MKAVDTVSRVHVITSSTTMLGKAEMDAILATFEEFQKSNEEEKDE